jgi:hypothetical protein
MKYTVVPAQVTTVEDRIAGSLAMNQLLLLIAPVFFNSVLYVILPPNLHFAIYKIVFMMILLLLCAISAIRIKGKILILWVVTLAKYNLRPKFYLYNKNSLATREEYADVHVLIEEETEDKKFIKTERLPMLALPDKVKIEAILNNPAAQVRFDIRKGGLNVHLTEVKD